MGRSTLPFRLRAAGEQQTHGPQPRMARKAEELEIVREPPAREAVVAREHGLHLVKENLLRDATPGGETGLEPMDERPEILPGVEAHPIRAGRRT